MSVAGLVNDLIQILEEETYAIGICWNYQEKQISCSRRYCGTSRLNQKEQMVVSNHKLEKNREQVMTILPWF